MREPAIEVINSKVFNGSILHFGINVVKRPYQLGSPQKFSRLNELGDQADFTITRRLDNYVRKI